MKIKVTIWFEDPETDKLTDKVKGDFDDFIRIVLQDEGGVEVRQVEIEESQWEDKN